ncbi:MAG: hypothetical protein B6D34_00215 [Candidatus Brocadia sp. UTAMX1]|jgi:hypothetical protein|nr:MAG: hypothetical protein B6D34_00215 [Candidatus Brocadia sp. UTAMX1]
MRKAVVGWPLRLTAEGRCGLDAHKIRDFAVGDTGKLRLSVLNLCDFVAYCIDAKMQIIVPFCEHLAHMDLPHKIFLFLQVFSLLLRVRLTR